ncbi:vomeronasal type-1 receptor 1-like [Lepus europaeus]|uniref:vomeronasal type-1 receptor 1-like n=1 Tax=Lepus europaeus TaxID=9983 RepID=UPI002B493FBA|nr:vomeronasal type-1 receptor 1-like [Lepus europaeus]
MASGKLEIGIVFFVQTAVGILGNLFLLCFYNFTLLTGHKLRPTDLILNQLTLANSLVLFSKGIPQTMAAFGLKYFLDDTGCKLVFYSHRLATGVSFSTICLLNGFQAIKIDSSVCKWMAFRFRSLKFIGFCCFLCWIPHLLLSTCILVIVNGPLDSRSRREGNSSAYCSWTMPENSSVYTVIYFSPDFMSLAFMLWASGTVVFVLHRHKKQVQHIHSHRHSSRPSPEARATWTVMILVSSFFSFYSVYTIMTVWMTLVANPGQWMVNSSVLVSSCFVAFAPFVLIISDTRVHQFCSACLPRRTSFPNLVAVS